MKRKGKLELTIGGKTISIKIKLLVAADFQFFKAIKKYTSAVWCLCQLDNLYKRPDAPAVTWADCLSFYASIGCELKTIETSCELNHYSVDV
eukprot:2583341-Prymnesium_polylepis.1